MRNTPLQSQNHSLLFLASLLIVIIGFISLDVAIQKTPTTSMITKAEGNDCEFCNNEPECCKEVESTHEAPCDWPTRGWCKPSTCAQIEGKGQRCGWYWLFHNANDNEYKLGTNSPNGYGCMIGESESTMKPRCTAQGPITLAPSNAPTPTQTAIPTTIPTLIPTEILQPTQEPLPPTAIPTQPNSAIPTTRLLPLPTDIPTNQVIIPTTVLIPSPQNDTVSTFRLPSFTLPKIVVPTIDPLKNIITVNTITQKPFTLFENIFHSIKQSDERLEEFINSQFMFIRKVFKK